MEVPRFWRESRARYNLEGVRCGNCGKVYFPPREVCPDCHRESIGRMEPFRLSGKGEIYSFSIVHNAPLHFKDEVPYIIALVKLEEGPIVTGQVVEWEENKVEIGTPVEAVFRKINEQGKSGVIQYGFKFRPVKETEGA